MISINISISSAYDKDLANAIESDKVRKTEDYLEMRKKKEREKADNKRELDGIGDSDTEMDMVVVEHTPIGS